MKVLVPTDFSSCAKNATRFAVQYAIQTDSDICLLNVYELKYTDAGLFIDFDDSMKDVSMAMLEKEKTKLLAEFSGLSEARLSICQEVGKLDQIIDNYAAKGEADLVVMGTKGRSGLDEILIGSETARVIGNTEIPTLAIPEKASFSKAKRVVFALDLKEELKRNEVEAIDGLLEEDKSVYLFHNYHDAFEIEIDDEHKIQSNFKNYFPGCLIYLDLNFDEDALKAIENYIDEVKPGVIVVRSKHRNLLQSLFHKSISEKLSYHTDQPLMVFK